MMDPTDRQAASRGFTVVELLVALGLAAVVFGLIVSFFANMGRSTTTQNAAAARQRHLREPGTGRERGRQERTSDLLV